MKRLGILVLVIVIPLAGCGKSSKSSDAKGSGSATTAAVAELTKADFIAKADPICAKVDTDVNALPDPKAPKDLEPLVRKVVGIIKPALAELRALKAAPADAALFKQHLLDPKQAELDAAERFLAKVPSANGDDDKITALAETFDSEMTDADTGSEAHDAALKTFGFSDCAKTND